MKPGQSNPSAAGAGIEAVNVDSALGSGMLARRGFDYETIRPVIDRILGNDE